MTSSGLQNNEVALANNLNLGLQKLRTCSFSVFCQLCSNSGQAQTVSHFVTGRRVLDLTLGSVQEVQFSGSVVCDSLEPHGLHAARPGLAVHH